MADADKRVGPFTSKQWLIGGVGGVAAYLGIRWWRGRSSTATTASTAGNTIPGGEPGTSTTSPAPTTLAAWQNAALAYGTNPIDTLNAVTNWLAGNCVDSGGYSGVAAAIQALGLPPGLTTLPVLTVCSQSTSTGSSTPATQTTPAPQNQPAPTTTSTPATTYSPGALISSLTAAGYTVGNSPTDTVQTKAIPLAVAPGNKVVTTQGPAGPVITVEKA